MMKEVIEILTMRNKKKKRGGGNYRITKKLFRREDV